MELRSMFSNIFGKKPEAVQQEQTYTKMEMLNSYTSQFYSFGHDIFADETVRACIDTIARHTAKTKAKHIGYSNSRLEYLLTVRPNQYMSSFDMIYKTITQLYCQNNAYILIQRDNSGIITGFYPINASTVEFLESKGNTFVQFTFMRGQKVTVSYDDVIHLRRHFNKHDLYGDSNSLLNTLELNNTVNQGLANAIKSSLNLKGLLKFTGTIKPEDIKKQKDAFVADYMSINNVGGIAATDSKGEYIPLKTEPVTAEHEVMEIIEKKIFKYFGVNEKILMNDFDENTWNAFWEGVLEPICIQMALEFTHKCFTERERGFGNKIEFSANRLNYASNTTKVAMCKELVGMGIFSINEARELFNLEAIEQDTRILSLNYIDAAVATEYQLGKVKKEGGTKDDGK